MFNHKWIYLNSKYTGNRELSDFNNIWEAEEKCSQRPGKEINNKAKQQKHKKASYLQKIYKDNASLAKDNTFIFLLVNPKIEGKGPSMSICTFANINLNMDMCRFFYKL